MNEEIYMLWLSSLGGLSSRKQNLLLETFGAAREIFDAKAETLASVEGMSERNVSLVTENRSLDRIESLLAVMGKKGVAYVSRFHDNYPAPLKQIPDPPAGLFYCGALPAANRPCVGIIGSRRCTEYGLTAARMFAKPLAGEGVVVVSGMARGIDGMAHKGAIEGGGTTVAVLGCGADVCYPAEHASLRDDIIKNGCVLSEYPPGTEPFQGNFPARNRIISGLCKVLLVVEAAKKSGTLITVGQANDQGRDIMAVPGSILNKFSEGTNQLIRDGAHTATCFEDVLDLLGIVRAKDPEKAAKPASDSLAPDEKIVYDCVNFEPAAFESLAAKTGIQAQALHYACTMLELKGFIRKLPGARYIRNI
ncbi:MAG: DNA-processing protein DprA [Defluviitaleaceae bacterium]|nr:DNA-processing protein DprA [Defluviitaleaceae bacterium]